MTNNVALYVFQIISSVSTIITLLPQAFLNYRLKSTNNLSPFTIILWIIGAQVSAVYLIWMQELLIISLAYAVFAAIALFIGCQIRYYKREKELVFPAEIKDPKSRLLFKYIMFTGNYILLVICSLMNGLALYYIFEITKSHSWVSKSIGSIVPTITDTIGFVPQIILIIRMKSAAGYSLLFILTEYIGSIAGIISVFLLESIDIVPLISFINLFIFQMIIMILKLCVFPDKNRNKNESNIQPHSDLGGEFDSKSRKICIKRRNCCHYY